MDKKSVGLVLSGGGAKGAYQVGMVRALAELGVRVDAVSGTSVGALNGAVLAASGSMNDGAERLTQLWNDVAEKPPLGNPEPLLVRLLEAAGLEIRPSIRNTAAFASEIRKNLLATLRSPETGHLVDNEGIRKLLSKFVTPEQLADGLPLYVSVFPNRNLLESVVGFGLAFVGIKDTPKSDFLHVQSLPAQDQQRALLASAAIPFLLEAQEINGELYSDGGLGGRLSSQGNTPIEPLAENGYKTIIVGTLSDHSKWDRQRYPGTTIIEIEREEPIDRNPILPRVFDVVSFQPEKIRSWIEQGYRDAVRCIKPKLSLLGSMPEAD